MVNFNRGVIRVLLALGVVFGATTIHAAAALDKMVGIHSARVMSQSMPWMAQEAGLFKKHNLEFSLVFISSSGIVTAALLGGDAEMTITGGVGSGRRNPAAPPVAPDHTCRSVATVDSTAWRRAGAPGTVGVLGTVGFGSSAAPAQVVAPVRTRATAGTAARIFLRRR